ncbi:MAG TPA: hypothetical protein VLN48_13150 [Bryobacteraceae bacterium]|nr:hypothetical protein [Bryobacteraceae bacterium]
MARAANLGGIGHRELPEIIEAKIEAEIVAGRAVRVAMTGVLVVAVRVAEDPRVVMRAVPAAAVADPSTISPKSSWRS